MFANMLSKFQAKLLINAKVTVSDILGSKSTILTFFAFLTDFRLYFWRKSENRSKLPILTPKCLKL